MGVAGASRTIIVFRTFHPDGTLRLLGCVAVGNLPTIGGRGYRMGVCNPKSVVVPCTGSVGPLAICSRRGFRKVSIGDFNLRRDNNCVGALARTGLGGGVHDFGLGENCVIAFSLDTNKHNCDHYFVTSGRSLRVNRLPSILSGHVSSCHVFG